MLTENQEKYLLKIPTNKIVRIIPFDPNVVEIVNGIKDQISRAGINLEVKFIGAAALGISGQGDIDLYIFCPKRDFQVYLPNFELIFGKKVEGIGSIKWKFDRGGHEIEMYLTDPTTPSMQDQLKVFEILNNNSKLLEEYETIKSSANGKTFREYMKIKYEFYNKIIN